MLGGSIPRMLSAASIFLLAAMAVLAGCGRPSSATQHLSASALVERGRYLASIGACHDCHTPMKLGLNGPEPDMSRAFSGHPEDFAVGPPPALGEGGWLWAGTGSNTAFAGPWGISFSANLTPDSETGTGTWSEETFIKASREGKLRGGGRPLQPPMPWPWYKNMTDDDLKAIFAYVQSLEPIVNHVPEHVPAPG